MLGQFAARINCCQSHRPCAKTALNPLIQIIFRVVRNWSLQGPGRVRTRCGGCGARGGRPVPGAAPPGLVRPQGASRQIGRRGTARNASAPAAGAGGPRRDPRLARGRREGVRLSARLGGPGLFDMPSCLEGQAQAGPGGPQRCPGRARDALRATLAAWLHPWRRGVWSVVIGADPCVPPGPARNARTDARRAYPPLERQGDRLAARLRGAGSGAPGRPRRGRR